MSYTVQGGAKSQTRLSDEHSHFLRSNSSPSCCFQRVGIFCLFWGGFLVLFLFLPAFVC